MWSDRPSAAGRQKLIEDLRGVLPPPRGAAASQTVRLRATASAPDVAGGLQALPGFIWLDRAGSRSRLFHDPLVRISSIGGNAIVEGPCGRLSIPVQGFDLLEGILGAWGGPANGLLCGYLGYELGAELEDLAAPARTSSDLPDLVLGLYDFNLEYAEDGWRLSGTDAWRGGAGLPFPAMEAEALLANAGRIPSPIPPAGPLSPGPVVSFPTDQAFQSAVGHVVRRIFDGEVFQVNICRRLEAPLEESMLWPAYLRLRAASPASQGAFIRLGAGSALLSVSPELFLSVQNGEVRSCPIKGTRPRGATPQEDRRLASELMRSEKDRAELAMIVDVMRSDLSRVCAPGSVSVASHARLMSLPTVHHLFSEVTGRLRECAGSAGLIRACFPPASISGAPKIRAIELAALEEGRLRGPCMGSIGWLSLDGRMEISVAIRTAAAAAGRIWYLAGCGITAGSDPTAELAESEAKASAFVQALALRGL